MTAFILRFQEPSSSTKDYGFALATQTITEQHEDAHDADQRAISMMTKTSSKEGEHAIGGYTAFPRDVDASYCRRPSSTATQTRSREATDQHLANLAFSAARPRSTETGTKTRETSDQRRADFAFRVPAVLGRPVDGTDARIQS